MNARVIQVTISPWYLDPHTCELRVRIEAGGKDYEDKRHFQFSDFESVFEQEMRMATSAIQRFIKTDLDGISRKELEP